MVTLFTSLSDGVALPSFRVATGDGSLEVVAEVAVVVAVSFWFGIFVTFVVEPVAKLY